MAAVEVPNPDPNPGNEDAAVVAGGAVVLVL